MYVHRVQLVDSSHEICWKTIRQPSLLWPYPNNHIIQSPNMPNMLTQQNTKNGKKRKPYIGVCVFKTTSHEKSQNHSIEQKAFENATVLPSG